MKGVDVAIADPIDPVDEYDKRPSVKELISTHKIKIDKLKDRIMEESIDGTFQYPSKHDDLWLLRFLLSHNMKSKNAIKAALHTLQFRKDHNLDTYDFRGESTRKDEVSDAQLRKYMEFCSDDFFRFCIPDQRRGVILYLSFAGLDQHAVVKNLDESAWLPVFTYITELQHQWVDYVTRTTGRLTKVVRPTCVEGVTLRGINMENSSRDGKAMGAMEDCYPQLLHAIYICNAPSWIQVPWRAAKLIMPKRVVEKIDFLHPASRKSERDKFLSFVSLDHLPAKYGGNHGEWPPASPTPKVPNPGKIR